jgi:hypothetical protein
MLGLGDGLRYLPVNVLGVFRQLTALFEEGSGPPEVCLYFFVLLRGTDQQTCK